MNHKQPQDCGAPAPHITDGNYYYYHHHHQSIFHSIISQIVACCQYNSLLSEEWSACARRLHILLWRCYRCEHSFAEWDWIWKDCPVNEGRKQLHLWGLRFPRYGLPVNQRSDRGQRKQNKILKKCSSIHCILLEALVNVMWPLTRIIWDLVTPL